MTVVAVIAAWSLLAALVCAMRWFNPALPPLAGVDDETWALDADGGVVRDRLQRIEIGVGARARTFLSLLGIGDPSVTRLQDLAIADINPDEHVGSKVALAIVGPATVVVPQTTLALIGGGVWVAPIALPLIASAAIGGYLLPDLKLRRTARRRRDELTAVVGFIARLARIAVAGGDGVDTALRRASTFGDSWAHATVRSALAEQHGRPAQRALDALGRTYGVAAAQQLADALIVAQENGSPVLDALAASAHGIHDDRLQAAEVGEARKSVMLSVPVGLMVLGYLIVLVGGFIAETLELFLK